MPYNDDPSSNDGEWEFNCNLCNYKLYMKNIRQIGVDGMPIPANENALKALFECRLYRSLDESCKRILITAIRKLSHSSDSKPVRMSLMAMHIQTESESDAEKLKKDATGINLRALLDSLPSTVIVGEHETRVNDILYSLADENKMSIRVKFPSWIRAITDVQERTMIQVIYRALWFSNPYGVRNLGLRMLLQEEVPECWETYKKKEGKTLRELLLKYRQRISGRREFLANDTLYKLKDGCSMEMPPIPQCTCSRTVNIPVSFDRKVFQMVDQDVFIQLFRIAIREVLVNCGGDQASSMLLDELKNRCSGEVESDNKNSTLDTVRVMSRDELMSRVSYLMRYDILCYLLSKRHPEIWSRMAESNKGSRKCRKDGLIDVMKNFEDFYLVTYKVRTPIITLLDNEGPDLRATAAPFVPSKGCGTIADPKITDATHLRAIPEMDNQFQRPLSNKGAPFNISSSSPAACKCGYNGLPNQRTSPILGEQMGQSDGDVDSNRLQHASMYGGYSQPFLDGMGCRLDVPRGSVRNGVPPMVNGCIDPTPRTRAQDSLKGLLGLMDRPNGHVDLSSGVKPNSENHNLQPFYFDTPGSYGERNYWDQMGGIQQMGNAGLDSWAMPSPYSSRNVQPLHYMNRSMKTDQSSNVSGSDMLLTPPSGLPDARHEPDFQEFYKQPIPMLYGSGLSAADLQHEEMRLHQRSNALDWIIACASPLNGVYNNMGTSPGATWEYMTRPYLMQVNPASETD